jgi:hypothetical protein
MIRHGYQCACFHAENRAKRVYLFEPSGEHQQAEQSNFIGGIQGRVLKGFKAIMLWQQ